MLKRTVIILFLTLFFIHPKAQVTLSTDFTNNGLKKDVLSNIWTVANRISPTNGANIGDGLGINTVRMLGGIKKTVNGVNVPDLAYDPCTYDSINNVYVYNWTPLLNRINALRTQKIKIFQLVIDQPPWAFQHGYTFIKTGTTDLIHFREDERMSTYGNSLPPCDKVAYSNFIKALMLKLLDTYPRAEVESWRFRVGSEIETPDHWYGSEQDFIEHYANTEKAIRSVLPNAKVGLHTREPKFVYQSGGPKNYKGESIKSFHKGLIDYCFANDVKYDFWGISDYVIVGGSDRDFSQKYNTYYADFTTNPKWDKNATIDIMEYGVLVQMGSPDPATSIPYLNCGTSLTDIINIGYSHLFYKYADKNLDKIYRWGTRSGSADNLGIDVVSTMLEDARYETTNTGSPTVANNTLDAIFAKNSNGKEYDVLVYNANNSSLDYVNDDIVKLSFAIDLPVGSTVSYRFAAYGKDQNKFQNFMLGEPATKWVKTYTKSGKTYEWDRKGSPSDILNAEGLAAWNVYVNPNEYKFGEWKTITTVARTDGGMGSLVKLDVVMPSFSFKKFEFKAEATTPPIVMVNPNWGFENGLNDWALLTAGVSIPTVGTTLPRTGTQSLVVTVTGIEKFAKNNNSIAPEIIVEPSYYLHAIAWVAADVPDYANFGFRQQGGASALTAGLLPNVYEQKTFDVQNNTAAAVTHLAGVKTKTVIGSATLYIDDIILYTDSNPNVDITKPILPTDFSAGAVTASSITFAWTNGTDPQTGIQKTIVLRAANSVTATPILNDQAIYSVTGGGEGPNMIGDWKVISTEIASDATSYTDNNNLVSETTYKYAVIHRDLAYNYSEALLGSASTNLVGTSVGKIYNSFSCFGTKNAIQLNDLTLGQELIVYNVAGSKVTTQRIENSAITIPMASGIYMVRVANSVMKVVVK